MKKAEAISILATSVRPREAKDRERYDKAVNMAIEALKQQGSSQQTAVGSQGLANDTVSRQGAIDAIEKAKTAKAPDGEMYVAKINAEMNIQLLPSVQPELHWIPCSERLPKEDVEVLISYRYKEGEGDTSHTDIDITTYGQMYFGGNKVGNYKHWRAPFEYFESNYEVIAWMPLPEPYQEEGGQK